MDLKLLTRPLTVDEIDFRIQSINKGWFATILAYKDARADMNRLDEVVWSMNWKREHTRDNQNCTVSIRDEWKKQWISKEDTWTESNTEKEKWLASDSFKRACFNWGIGRELYDYPIIQIKLDDKEWDKNTWKPTYLLKLKEWTWFTQFDKNNKLNYIGVKDQNWKLRFQRGEYKK